MNSKQQTGKLPAKQQLADMEMKITETGQRNLNGSIEQCKEELRDAYMNFKDLQQRCIIDLKENLKGGNQGADGHKVFYFKPETFLLDEPEKQKSYRENLLRRVGALPRPKGISYMGDELHRSMCQSVGDRSTPKATKAMLAEFFKQKQYTLQHMKYKLLCRWAHHALTSEQIEKISPDATFIYGKLEFNLEQAMERLERLSQEDYFDKANPENRPSTKAELGQGALYVEKFDLAPQSLIREDDIEVYMRGVTYRNKINKVVNKFISRLKWVPLSRKYEIFEKAIEGSMAIKNANIKRQTDMLERVEKKVKQIYTMTPELQTELTEVLDGYYCKQYESMFLSNIEKTIYSWKPNHDQVPGLISDQQLLKLKIQDAAALHQLTGDIELDHGYSFSYQVTVFFPSYFQRQVIKSQFSIYDAFAGDESDPNMQQKRVLTTATRLDMNIFLDVSTAKNTVPTEEAFQFEFKNSNIKILRLKSAAYWIDYVALQPIEPDWHFKQQAILNNDNPIDTLLQQALNFLDVNDLATVNRINEDNAHLHQETLRKLQKHNPHNFMVQSQVSTSDGDKKVTVDQSEIKNSLNQATNIEKHLFQAVSQQNNNDSDQVQRSNTNLSGGILRQLPTHLLVSYNSLRFLSSRDSKTRIMYTLNYFRSVQKRLALDLREFATRDRIEGHMTNPFIQSKEANQNIINQSALAAKTFDIKDTTAEIESENKKKMTVFDEDAIKDMKDMATLRGYKAGGLFNNRIFHTCPSFPKFHATHGEPLTKMTEAEEMDRKNEGKSISDRAIKLMGRIDFVEINETLKEVYVRDDFGIYIMYDCVLQDMKFIERELAKVGSYFLHKSEALVDPEKQQQGVRAYPLKDRLELLDDILRKESEFQFAKVKVIQVYLECYEHVCDPLEQQKLMQVITDYMSRRPRLNLNANYFIDAYDAEILLLQKQFELVRTLVDLQISLEKTENKRLQDSLNLSYTLANQYSKNKWKYQDAESLLQAIEKTRQAKEEADQYVKKMQQKEKDEIENDKQKNHKGLKIDENKATPSQHNSSDHHQTSKISNKGPIDDGLSSEMSLDEAEYYKNDENQFTQLLGLPQVTIETIYQSYREKDQNVIKMMREHSNFIAIYEGYPEFLTQLTHRSILDKNRLFKPNQWSQETGALDFYDSLDFITKFYAVKQQVQQELYDGLKMWDTTLMTQIDIQFAEFGLEELRRVQSFMDGSKTEYQGRELLEDESIMGNSEKLIFYAKEMIADLTNKPKHLVDPFLVSKLDIQTINFFDFPKIKYEMNKYTMRKNGIAGAEYMAMSEKEAITKIAKEKTNKGVSEILGGKVGDVLNRRNIFVPSLLQTYLNMVELHRLRNELILAASETAILQEVYVKQCELVGVRNTNTQLPEGIAFDPYDFSENSEIRLVNFVDHGPSHDQIIELAAAEFDPVLLSNLNFRNPDTFKINIITSGLEEIRAILSYQLLQKTLLIVATRINSLLIDSYQKGISELNLIERSKIAVPNSIVQYNTIINRSQDFINLQSVKMLRSNYKQSMSTYCIPIFYNVVSKKNQQRTQIAKEYSTYQIAAQNKFNVTPYCVLRVMRSFKVKLLVKFVQNIATEVCLDAQKVQALQACQRLRYYQRYFSFDPLKLGLTGSQQQILKLETHGLIENFPANYAPDHILEKEDKLSQSLKKKEEIKVINTSSYEIVEYAGIPSSVSIVQTDAVPLTDLRIFKEKRKEFSIKRWGKDFSDELREVPPEINDPEIHLKQLLMSFTSYQLEDSDANKKSIEELEQQVKKKIGTTGSAFLDYEEGLYFGNSQFGNMIKYYITLERILALEWFIVKLQFAPKEVINMEHALDCGLPFWKEDEFDARATTMPEKTLPENVANLRSQQFFFDQIVGIRQKRFIAEAVNSMGLTLKNFIAQYVKTKQEQRSEYLIQYVEFRYQQIAGSLHKLVQQFYYQKNLSAVSNVQAAISKFTKMEHVRFVCLKPNNYSVDMSMVNPMLINLESGNLIFGSIQQDEITNFMRTIKPIINEKALEPSQLTLFQALYQSDPFRRNSPSQYAGQVCSERVAFKALETALLGLSVKERQYSQSFIVQAKFQANDFMETVFGDSSMANLTNEDAYTLNQLIDAKKFINETTQALLLRNALMCWSENSVLPADIDTYERFEKNFRQNFFWKQLEQKEEIAKKLQQSNSFGQIPTEAQLKELKQKIDRMVNDHNLATQSEVEKRDALVKVLREEFASLKKKVTLDNYFSTKAEIQVYSNEIEKFVIRASVQTLDSECAALAKCFTLQVPQIQYHIHPFQQFAATFFDQVDPNMHLDLSNKVIAVQSLITKMRNRGTEVETLTSGPGMVFTIKDINEILIDFCNITIKDQEKQFKSRSELFKLMEDNYRNLIYQKDQKINSLEHRIKNIGLNLENIIDARLFERGNQLIYELDSSNRVLSLFKSAMFGLEKNLYERIIGEQLHKFKRNLNQLELKTRKFDDYKQAILNMVNADFAADQDRIKVILKDMADQAKITEKEGTNYKKSLIYPISGAQQQQSSKQTTKGGDQYSSQILGAVVPQNFKHYPECSCYVADAKYPKPTLELAGLEIMSEREAREELARTSLLVRKQRIVFRVKEMFMMKKYQDKINLLEKQLTNNSHLWDQLAESQKRERVLKQELLYTQQSQSTSEKIIEKMKEDIKELEAERGRLAKFKSSKAEKLKELEEKVKKMDLFENIDGDKLIAALTKKDQQLKEMQTAQSITQQQVEAITKRRDLEVQKLKRMFAMEQQKTQTVVERMDQMKLELKMLEANDSSVATIWKKKCLDLFELCQSMKVENDELRERCKELIEQGLNLASVMSDQKGQTSQFDSYLPQVNPVPKQNPYTQKRDRLASTANTFQKTVVDTPQKDSLKGEQLDPYEYLPASAPWGVKSPETTHIHQPIQQVGYQTMQRGRTQKHGKDIRSILSGSSDKYSLQLQQPNVKQALNKQQQYEYTNPNQTQYQSAINRRKQQQKDHHHSVQPGFRQITTAEPPQMFKLKNATRLIRIEPVQASFDVHGKTIQNPKLQEIQTLTVSQQASQGKNWAKLKVNTNVDINEGKAESNGALSSQNLNSNDFRNASHLSTVNKAQINREQKPDEIPEEAYPPMSAKSEEFTVRQQIDE